MQPKWHIAFCNVTYTEYAKVTYRDYYSSPAVMLEAQLAAKEYAEQRFGVGRFMNPAVDIPSCSFPELFGMPVIEPNEDEIPYLDTMQPAIRDVAEVDTLHYGDPGTTGWMSRRYEFWQYYRERGHNVGFGGAGGAVISTAMEVTGNGVLTGMYEDPDNTRRVLDVVMDAYEMIGRFAAELVGSEFHGFTYTGDDYAGLLSPELFRRFAVPCYNRLHAENTQRYMHSELLRAEHLRIARDEVGITDFHGAGCKNLTLEEMYEIMGEAFWTQLTPQEMLEMSPAEIIERIKEFAGCGCHCVQLYPGRDVPERNMEAAVAACRAQCTGGPMW